MPAPLHLLLSFLQLIPLCTCCLLCRIAGGTMVGGRFGCVEWMRRRRSKQWPTPPRAARLVWRGDLRSQGCTLDSDIAMRIGMNMGWLEVVGRALRMRMRTSHTRTLRNITKGRKHVSLQPSFLSSSKLSIIVFLWIACSTYYIRLRYATNDSNS